MAWGQPGVSKLQLKSDSVTQWGSIGAQKTVQVTKSGIIKNLRMIHQGAVAYAGATSASKMGPFNSYTSLELLGNSQQDVFRLSGYGAALYEMVKRGLEEHLFPTTAAVGAPINVTDQDYVFDGQATTAPASNPNETFSLNLPVSQRVSSLGGDIGMIPMATENAQLAFIFTPNAVSLTGSTYTIQSTADDLSMPFYGANAVTIANPSVDLMRIMYEPVQNEQDFPDFNWVSQVIEEAPQAFSGNGFTWKQNQDAGILLRLIFGVWTSASPWGITTGNLAGNNALKLSYNTDIVKFQESGVEALARQRRELGFDLPYGVFFYDMLGKDLTLADVLDSYTVPAIQLQMNFSSAVTLNGTVNPKVIAQRLLPLRVA